MRVLNNKELKKYTHSLKLILRIWIDVTFTLNEFVRRTIVAGNTVNAGRLLDIKALLMLENKRKTISYHLSNSIAGLRNVAPELHKPWPINQSSEWSLNGTFDRIPRTAWSAKCSMKKKWWKKITWKIEKKSARKAFRRCADVLNDTS